LNRCSNYLKKKKTEKLQNFLSKHLFFREILRICFDRIMLKKKKEFVYIYTNTITMKQETIAVKRNPQRISYLENFMGSSFVSFFLLQL